MNLIQFMLTFIACAFYHHHNTVIKVIIDLNADSAVAGSRPLLPALKSILV